MQSDDASFGFRIWGVDDVVYGPVELPILVEWVKEERVTAQTWVHNAQSDSWQKAPRVPELRMFFRNEQNAGDGSQLAAQLGHFSAGIKPASFRRVKILADLADDQLERFVEFMEVIQIRQWQDVVHQGDPGDAMYLILEGELRVRLMIDGKETIIATLAAGEFFGEVALFDQGARSADVIANQNSVLLKITAEAFSNLLASAPDLAAPFLFSIGKTLIARIRADNKRYQDSIKFARTAMQ